MGITIEKHVFKLNYFITIFFKKFIIRYGNSITFYLKACLNIACCMLCAGGDGGGGGCGGGDSLISRPKCTWIATVLLTVNTTLYPCTIFHKITPPSGCYSSSDHTLKKLQNTAKMSC